MKLKSLMVAAVALAGLAFGAGQASANSIEITVSSPVVTPIAGGFDWAYDLVLTPSNRVVSADPTPSATSTTVFDNSVGGSTGSVGVFFDIVGLFGVPFFTGTVDTPTADWAVVVEGGSSPIISDSSTLSLADGGLPNVVVKYIGTGFTNTTASNVTLGTLHFSSIGGLTGAGTIKFGARDYDPRTGVAVTNTNSQSTIGPAVIPVPAAAWMGLSTLAGLAGMGIIRRRRMA
jgi:hypothetical protein